MEQTPRRRPISITTFQRVLSTRVKITGWTNDIFYQNNTPATDDIYQHCTLAIDRHLDDYL